MRGKVLDQIVAEQIPVAERLRPDLVAFCAGGNDIIRFSCDTDDLARRFDDALARITATGAHVLVFTGFDLGRMHPLIRRLRGRIACYNELMQASAERRGGTVVDLWGMREWVLPFMSNRLQGRDIGEGFLPKRPELLPLQSER